MNKQKLIDELNTEIDRLSKARDLLKGGEVMPIDSALDCTAENNRQKLIELLRQGPFRRGEIVKELAWHPDYLNTVIQQTKGVRTYGKGWVALVDHAEQK